MDSHVADTAIENETMLRTLYPPPRYLRIWDRLSASGREFIARSPLLIVGSVRPGQGIDLSPRGGPPGFVFAPDDQTLVIPDRAGNNRLDTMSNLLVDCRVGLLFLVPGVATILRIKGVARLEREPQDFPNGTVQDSARLRIVVTIRSAFIHCPRALHHSRLWDADYRTGADPATS